MGFEEGKKKKIKKKLDLKCRAYRESEGEGVKKLRQASEWGLPPRVGQRVEKIWEIRVCKPLAAGRRGCLFLFLDNG